jgi:hypothetical protein
MLVGVLWVGGGGGGGGGGACIAAYIIGLGLRVQTHPSQGKETRRGLEGTYFTHLGTFVCTTIALKVCEHEIFCPQIFVENKNIYCLEPEARFRKKIDFPDDSAYSRIISAWTQHVLNASLKTRSKFAVCWVNAEMR